MFCHHSLDKSGMPKGGSRHTKKPEVDVGLLLKVFQENSSLVANLGTYETIGRSQSCHPKGLITCLPLTKGLLELSDTGEIHSSSLRQAMMNLLVARPSLNDTIYNGKVWCGSRCERIGVVLYHMRRLKFGGEMKIAAAHLTGADLQKLQEVVDLIEKKLKFEEQILPLAKREDEPGPSRKLKKEVSDVSIDSKGFPNCFNSPKGSLAQGNQESSLTKGNGAASSGLAKNTDDKSSLTKGKSVAPPNAQALEKPSFLRRRPGQHMAQETTKEENKNLQSALGFGVVKKKPAGKASNKEKPPKKTIKKPAASLPKGGPKPLLKGSGERKPWTRLTWVETKKAPWRAYICGSQKPKALAADCKLIVETRGSRSFRYLEILEKIYDKLEKEHYTKEEALQLRSELEGSL